MTACYVRFTPFVCCPLYKKDLDLLLDLTGFYQCTVLLFFTSLQCKMLLQAIEIDIKIYFTNELEK